MSSTLRDRFDAKWEPDPLTGCWLWNACTVKAGYGRIGRGTAEEGPANAHRVAYELYVGPIPDGLQIDHLCRTPACVNPQHLEPVTPRENTLRGLRGRLTTHCPRGHEYTPENTGRANGRRKCRACDRAQWRRKHGKGLRYMRFEAFGSEDHDG